MSRLLQDRAWRHLVAHLLAECERVDDALTVERAAIRIRRLVEDAARGRSAGANLLAIAAIALRARAALDDHSERHQLAELPFEDPADHRAIPHRPPSAA